MTLPSCRSVYWRTYYTKHKEDKADYYAAFSVEIRERQKEYDAAHKDERKAYNAAYYQRRKEKLAAKASAYYAEHKDEVLARRKKQRKAAGEYKAAGGDVMCVYGCDDCFYFGEEYEGAFYCAFDSEHTHPLDIDANCMCFMKQGGLKRWRSIFDKPRRKVDI